MFISVDWLLLCLIIAQEVTKNTELNAILVISWHQLLPDHYILGLCTNVEHLSPAHAEGDADQRERTTTCFSTMTPFNHIVFSSV